MRHVGPGLLLGTAELERLAPTLVAAGRALHDAGQHPAAHEVFGTAFTFGAVVDAVADMAAEVADDRQPEPTYVTLSTWASAHSVPVRTARRWFARGRVSDARKINGHWEAPSEEPDT